MSLYPKSLTVGTALDPYIETLLGRDLARGLALGRISVRSFYGNMNYSVNYAAR